MPTKKPIAVATRRPVAVAAKRPAEAPPPPVVEDDDPFGSAEAAPAAPAKPAASVVKRVAIPPRSKAPTRPERVITPEEVREKYGTSGAPDAVAQAANLKGSEVFGAPPPKSGGESEGVVDAPQEQVAGGPQAQRTPPARGRGGLRIAARSPVDDLRQAAPEVAPAPGPVGFEDLDAAIHYILTTNGADYRSLSENEKWRRDYAFRLWVTDLLAAFDVVGEVADSARVQLPAPMITPDDAGRIANAVAESAAGAAHGAGADEAWAGAFEEGEGEAPTLPAGMFVMPSGVKMTFEKLARFVLDYASATFATQGRMDKELGLPESIGTMHDYRSLKSETQEGAREKIAERIASDIIEKYVTGGGPQNDGPSGGPEGADAFDEDDGAWDNPEDDGSEASVEGNDETPSGVVRQMAAAGRAGASAPAGPPDDSKLRFAFEGEKLGLANRAEALICGNCQQSAKFHKGLKGATSSNSCPGFVPANKAAAEEHRALLRDTAAFKTRYAALLAPPKSPPAEPVLEPVTHNGGDEVAGDVGREGGIQGQRGAVRPAVSRVGHGEERVAGQSGGAGPAAAKSAGVVASGRGAGGRAGVASAADTAGGGRQVPSGQVVGQVREQRVGEVGGDSGPDEEPFDGFSSPPEGTGGGASGGGVSDGADLPPAEYRADAEEQRRAWAAAEGDEFTAKLTWAINYPPNGENLAPPSPLPNDLASVERRDRVTQKVEQYISKHLFGGHGQLREDVEYGSPGWRAFVTGRRLAAACEEYTANRHADREEAVQNKVQRAAKDYVMAHYTLPEGTPDPYFNEYVEMCFNLMKPIGTPVEELMAGQ